MCVVENFLQCQGLFIDVFDVFIWMVFSVNVNVNVLCWFEIVCGEFGIYEICGSQDNLCVFEYYQVIILKVCNDEMLWCLFFVNWMMQQVGVQGMCSVVVCSWLNWGQVVFKDVVYVKFGDVIVFFCGNNLVQGYVVIVFEVFDNGMVCVIGGNQGVCGEYYDGVMYLDCLLVFVLGVCCVL